MERKLRANSDDIVWERAQVADVADTLNAILSANETLDFIRTNYTGE